jgi:hypothetical protein
MRIQALQHRLGELGIVAVEPFGHARGQQGERLDQPFNVRILGMFAGDEELAGRLRIPLCKLARVSAKDADFALVVR